MCLNRRELALQGDSKSLIADPRRSETYLGSDKVQPNRGTPLKSQ